MRLYKACPVLGLALLYVYIRKRPLAPMLRATGANLGAVAGSSQNTST